MCDRIAAFPGPALAALNGHALGGGAEFAVAADIRLAADDVKIGFNQVTLAIMPAWGGAERLAALVGKGRALLLAGTGTHPGRRRGAAARPRRRRGVARESFEDEWRARRAQARPTVRSVAIKRVIAGRAHRGGRRVRSPSLWVSDEHWAAADKVMDKVMKRGK